MITARARDSFATFETLHQPGSVGIYITACNIKLGDALWHVRLTTQTVVSICSLLVCCKLAVAARCLTVPPHTITYIFPMACCKKVPLSWKPKIIATPTKITKVHVVFVLACRTITEVLDMLNLWEELLTSLRTALRKVCTVTVSCCVQSLITQTDGQQSWSSFLWYIPKGWSVACLFSQ